MADASMKQVMDFFGMKISEFRPQWAELSESDKSYFKSAVGEVL